MIDYETYEADMAGLSLEAATIIKKLKQELLELRMILAAVIKTNGAIEVSLNHLQNYTGRERYDFYYDPEFHNYIYTYVGDADD